MVLLLFLLAPLLRLVMKPILWLLTLHLLVRAPGILWHLVDPSVSEESIHLLNGLVGTPLVLLFLIALVRRMLPRRRRRRRPRPVGTWGLPIAPPEAYPVVYPCPCCGGTHHP